MSKPQYRFVNISKHDYVSAAEAATSSGSRGRPREPMVSIGAGNEGVVDSVFMLPDPNKCELATIEVAYRILPILVTKELYQHLPENSNPELIGAPMPFFTFAYHKGFGQSFSNTVCPASTRSYPCPICKERAKMFRSRELVEGKITKDDILGNGFGTRNSALVFARIYYNGEDYGNCVFNTALTSEYAKSARFENFFDLVDQLLTPKRLIQSEVLPPDYYMNGSNARWLVAEYTRSVFTRAAEDSYSHQAVKKAYWKLSKITPAVEIAGVGKAENIWWREMPDGTDAITALNPLACLNIKPQEELEADCKLVHDKIFTVDETVEPAVAQTPQQAQPAIKIVAAGNEGDAVKTDAAADASPVTWDAILRADKDELVRLGVAKGSDADALEATATRNIYLMRNLVGKLYGVTPHAVHQE